MRGPVVVVCLAIALFIGHAGYAVVPSADDAAILQSKSALAPFGSLQPFEPRELIESISTLESVSSSTIPSATTRRTELQQSAGAPAPPPLAKRRRLTQAPTSPSGPINDGQINDLKSRLRLTSDQGEYWPAVEVALRNLVRTQSVRRSHDGKIDLDVKSPGVQTLIRAAMPLLIRLREDQKIEVRKLARLVGLEQVASQI